MEESREIRNLVICTVQVLYVQGGAETLTDELQRQLKSRSFNAEVVKLPFRWSPAESILNTCIAWRLLDLQSTLAGNIDRIICTNFPSYTAHFPDKITWLYHQHRQVYDLQGTEFSPIESSCRDLDIQARIRDIDIQTLKECRRLYTISSNIGKRLQKYNELDSSVLYPPPRNSGRSKDTAYEDFIFTAGRLNPTKRFDLLLKAVKLLNEPAKLIIAGQGEQEANLKKMAHELGVQDRVVFLGYIDDSELFELYDRCSVVVHVPLDEDYGMITPEAFAARKPVVCAEDSGGALEFVKHDVNGIITAPSPEPLANALQTLIHNRHLCIRMGAAGYESVKKLNWDYIIQELTRP